MGGPSKGGSKKGGGDILQQKSPAEFFAENKNIAGFDNVRRRSAAQQTLCLCSLPPPPCSC